MISAANVLSDFPNAKIVAVDKPLFCQHCDEDVIPKWRTAFSTAPMPELVSLLTERRSKIVQCTVSERVDWICSYCGRVATTTKKPAEKQDSVWSNFFEPLFAKCQGNIELRSIPSKTRLFSRNKGEIMAFIRAHQDENVFVGIATRREKDGSKKGTHRVQALWADIDFKDFKGGEPEARKRLASFPRPPSFTVASGHGLHCYWLLDAPVPLDTDEQRTKFERILKGVAKQLNADVAAAEVARVLRVPGTFNHKNGEKIFVRIEVNP